VRYPVLPLNVTEQLAKRKYDGYDDPLEPHVTRVGDSEDLSLTPIAECAQRLTSEVAVLPDDVDRDREEGRAALALYEALSHVPIEVLDDPGFWRFLALRYFWDFIRWREAKPFANGNIGKYVNGVSSTESVLPRMYLRAKALDGASDPSLAWALESATDFWRSHVIRVQTGSAPAVTAAFARSQRDARLGTDNGLRELAKLLNRSWTNIVMHVYDEIEAAAFIDELRDRVTELDQGDV